VNGGRQHALTVTLCNGKDNMVMLAIMLVFVIVSLVFGGRYFSGPKMFVAATVVC
jgi:hypothetical protein